MARRTPRRWRRSRGMDRRSKKPAVISVVVKAASFGSGVRIHLGRADTGAGRICRVSCHRAEAGVTSPQSAPKARRFAPDPAGPSWRITPPSAPAAAGPAPPATRRRGRPVTGRGPSRHGLAVLLHRQRAHQPVEALLIWIVLLPAGEVADMALVPQLARPRLRALLHGVVQADR